LIAIADRSVFGGKEGSYEPGSGYECALSAYGLSLLGDSASEHIKPHELKDTGEHFPMSNGPGRAMYRFLECTASQYMTPAVEAVTRQVTMRDLETLFEKHDFNAFPVVEAGKVLGIVTKFDFLRAFAFTTSQIVPHFDELMRRTVADVMTEAVVHVEPAAPLTRVLQLMVSLSIRSFPVIGSDRQLVGMISREDVMRALRETTQEAQ